MTSAPVISVRDIELQLRARCESVVRHCLPNAIKDGPYLKVGSIAGEKGSSLVVPLQGASRGMWTDYSAAGGPGGTGDMICLIEQTMFGGDRGQAVSWAKSWLGIDDLDPGRLATMRAESAARNLAADEEAARETESKKRGARALWMKAAPLTGTCPASRYLQNRGIDFDRLGGPPGSLRYFPEVFHTDAGVKLPCLLATMVTPDGAWVATHRTWLGRDRDGRWVKASEADVGVPKKKTKMVLGRCGGSFVPIRKGASGVSMSELRTPETIYMSEGIEDALTAAMLKPEARVAAGYSLKNLGFITFPETIATIVIIADRDEDQREVDALEAAIARQQARGHKVQTVMPPVGVKDLNAWLLLEMERAA